MLEKILEDTEQLINMHYEDDSVKFLISKKFAKCSQAHQ